MTNPVFDKTDKGREEIATRKYQLASRMRTLLLLVDGKQGQDALLKKVTGLGLTEDSIKELLDNGFIQVIGGQEQAETPPPHVPAPAEQSAPPAAGEPAIQQKADRALPAGENQFEAIYHFYTETIKSTLGLRGFALQMKVERAGSIDEFRALRQAYLEAVLKARGNEMARSLRTRLDELLYLGETPPNTILLGPGTNQPE